MVSETGRVDCIATERRHVVHEKEKHHTRSYNMEGGARWLLFYIKCNEVDLKFCLSRKKP